MGVKDIVILAVIIVVIACAILYIYKAKKNGKKCIGCPDGCCSSKNGKSACCSGCGGKTKEQK